MTPFEIVKLPTPSLRFYCHEPLGGDHRPNCVLLLRTVVVKMEVTVPICVPADWDEDQIEFWLNDSSWCADNMIQRLEELDEAKGDRAPCLCNAFKGAFVREATADDLTGIDLVKFSGVADSSSATNVAAGNGNA
jgi:hypothetical protein